MSTCIRTISLCLVLLGAFLSIGHARMTKTPIPFAVEGPMELGMGTGNVFSPDGKEGVTFTFDKPFAGKLIRTCQDGTWCRVTGTMDEQGNLLTVSSATPIKPRK